MRFAVVVAVLTYAVRAHAASLFPTGEVRLPLEEWEQMLDTMAAEKRRVEPVPSYAVVRRELDATFERGVLTGRLTVDLETSVGRQPLMVPLIGHGASPADIEIDGGRAVVTPTSEGYAALVTQSGRHRVVLRFVAGERQDRFRRAIMLPLPPSPITVARLDLPETNLDIVVESGAVLATKTLGARTQVELALGSAQALNVHWQRRLSHTQRARELEARTYVVASVREDVLRCETTIAYRVVSGDTARIEVAIPPKVEVTHVTGDAVLQWTTELTANGAQKLIVLLRYLVDDGLTIAVHTQMPRDKDSELRLIEPIDTKSREGFLAIEGRPGVEITVLSKSGVSEIGTRELPRELTDMSQRPLLFGYRYEEGATLVLQTKRNAEVSLTDSVIDEIEAATVIAEPGTENTKLRLHIRNNNRQYLALEAPPGAKLTHALIDGAPFHPAVSRPASGTDVLLVPLRQSERVGTNEPRYYHVRAGDTVGGLALRYYNKVERARDIVASNPALRGQAEMLAVGQRLVIPRGGKGATVEESSFVVELAYKLDRGGLGIIGTQRTSLPKLDLPVMEMSWQYFFPEAYTPLHFRTNLKQHNAIRYLPLARVKQFLEVAFSGRRAWAGGDYANILRSRKAIFAAEQQVRITEALASFPLIGERYRFSRVLLGKTPAEVSFAYMRREVAIPVRILMFLLTLTLTAWILVRTRQHGLRAAMPRWGWPALAGITVLAFVFAHYISGAHRCMLWGANVAMAAIALRQLGSAQLQRWRREPLALDWLGLIHLRRLLRLAVLTVVAGFFAMFPMLLGTGLFVLLLVVHTRWRLTANATVLLLALSLTAAVPNEAYARDAIVPLDTWSTAREQVMRIRRGETQGSPVVVVGEARYEGRAEASFLRLHLTLHAHLGQGPGLRRLPVIGTGAVVLSATSRGRPLALQRGGPGWEWVTSEQGLVDVEADILVPPSGPRGSIEYRFTVAPSPATQLICLFPGSGLSPQVTGALTNDVRAVSGGSQLTAILGRVSEIHIVGFHELTTSTDARSAKLYSETQNLFSFGDDRIELFSVIRFTILYAPEKRFSVALPAGYELVKADGEGAFQYTVVEQDNQRVLTGETAYGIRQRYEISIRLAKPQGAGESAVPLSLPRVLNVERDSGFVAIEVPGKLSIEGIKGEGLRAIDVRELPTELIESSVTPLVRAFQYDHGGATATAQIARYPEMPLAAGGVDELTADTVLTSDGRLMTDVRFSVRNNLQQYLAMGLDEHAQIQSAFVEGEPVKPTRDARGLLLLPLVRSPQGPDGLRPIRLQLVYEMQVGAFGIGGSRRLELPQLQLPLAVARWKISIPKGYSTSALEGAVLPQTFAGHGTWSRPPEISAGGMLWKSNADFLDTDTAGAVEGQEDEFDQGPMQAVQAAPPSNALRGRPRGEAQTAAPRPPRDAEGSGAVSVRIDLPRSGHEILYTQYWVSANEPIFVSFRFLSQSAFAAFKVLLALLIAALLLVALWSDAPPAPSAGWRHTAAWAFVVLTVAAWLGLGSGTALAGVLLGALGAALRRGVFKTAISAVVAFWQRCADRTSTLWRRSHEQSAASREAAAKRGLWAAASAWLARSVYVGIKLAVVFGLVVALVLIATSLLSVFSNPA